MFAGRQKAGPEHHVIHVICDHARHGHNEARRILIVRMNHDYHVGARGQRFAIARLLVAPVSIITIVDEHA